MVPGHPVKTLEGRIAERWALKNWCFWTVVLETFESPLDYKEIKPVNPKGNQSWIFIGRTDAEAETPILWLPDGKNWLIEKDPDAVGKIEGRRRRGQQSMRWLHHQLGGHEFEQTLGVGDGQGSLTCYSPWDRKESDMTEWLKWAERKGRIGIVFPTVVFKAYMTSVMVGKWEKFGVSKWEAGRSYVDWREIQNSSL